MRLPYIILILLIPPPSLTGMIKIQRGSESALQVALATFGPVTAVVDSRHNTFQVSSQTTQLTSQSPALYIHTYRGSSAGSTGMGRCQLGESQL